MTQQLNLTIGTRHFHLPPDTDVSELEHRLQQAVRVGGALITLPGTDGHTTSTLITPGLPVFLDRTDTVEDTIDADEDPLSAIDLDFYSSYET